MQNRTVLRTKAFSTATSADPGMTVANATVFAVALAAALGCLLAGCQPANTDPAFQEAAAAARSPIVGKPAPDFTLPDQDDNPVALSKLRGQWVVLYFYPKDDTPGCSCQATEFTHLLKEFREMNAMVYGVSQDSPTSHKGFIARLGLGMDLLSDPNHVAMGRYGAWVVASPDQNPYGRAIRTTMIIDPEGIIRYHWMEVMPTGHAERVRQKLAQLQREAKH
jgi:thioredoxin-dependent peroxiredoxin